MLSTNQGFKSFPPVDALFPEFLYYFLIGNRNLLLQYASGTTFLEVSGRNAAKIPVPIPPLAEQRRIVAAIEEHLSRLEAAVAGLKRVRAMISRYRAAVLCAAFEAKLVDTEAFLARQQHSSYESGSELLARLGLEKLNGNGSNGPEGWAVAPLRGLAALKGGVTKGQKRRTGTRLRSVPYLRVANVQRGYLDLEDMQEIPATEEEIQELALKPGDVLFNEGGDRDKLGRGWVWQGEIPVCIHQNHVFRARPVAGLIDSRFLSWYGNSFGQRYFNDEGKQTTNLASVNMTKLGALPVPVPPFEEQQRIVEEVDRRFSVLDALTRETDAALARAARLRQSILQRAFEGKLVPQDPNDEPASVLLERIRAARTSGSRPKTGRRTARA
ncbi:MAG: restriction endonuclease subunit S [Gemmatimonadetes bacterium]|nr:restriction endonuclease subunit S [Gemmatimonadota bacterium]